MPSLLCWAMDTIFTLGLTLQSSPAQGKLGFSGGRQDLSRCVTFQSLAEQELGCPCSVAGSAQLLCCTAQARATCFTQTRNSLAKGDEIGEGEQVSFDAIWKN